jgi:hypothetical protein
MTDSIDPANSDPFRSLRRLARAAAESAEEHCDLCGEPIPADHRHLLNLANRELLCACRACVILFDRSAAGGGTRRLVPNRYRCLAGFEMTDAQWESLRIPVSMAFFCRDTTAGRVMAFYPSPMGPTESLLPLETWDDLAQRHPILSDMEPDVEALLVNRTHGAREYYLVPIDECYKLVGVIRAYWRGLSGGREVWQEIDRFFAALEQRSTPKGRADA